MDSKLRCVFDMPDQNVTTICFISLMCILKHVMLNLCIMLNMYAKILFKFYRKVLKASFYHLMFAFSFSFV